MNAATAPRHGAHRARLLAIDENGQVSHHDPAGLPSLLRRGDLVIANDAATLPASLQGTHVRTGAPVEARLAGRRSLASHDVTRVTAVIFGAGDYRTPVRARPIPTRTAERARPRPAHVPLRDPPRAGTVRRRGRANTRRGRARPH